MIREHLFKKRAPADPDFRWRGGDVSRLEGFSDGIFSITITLLVVSTAAPKTFFDIWIIIKDLPAFIASFTIIMMAWHDHYIFYRRYGLEDGLTKVLNSLYLFLIMFFAFPLKFLCTFLWYLIIGENTASLFVLPESYDFSAWLDNPTPRNIEFFQRIAMMYLYGFGLLGVFGIQALQLWRALKKSDQLELDKLERQITINGLAHQLIVVVVSILSLTVLYTTGYPAYSGITYFILPFAHGFMGWFGASQVEKIKQEMAIAQSL